MSHLKIAHTMKKDRFLNVLRWQLMLSKQRLVTFALVFFAIIAIPQALGLLIDRGANTQVETAHVAMFALSVYLTMAGTTIFTHLKTRQQRINDFMLPASTKEKFIARYVVIVVALPLAAIVGFLAGDAVQYLLSLVFGSDVAGSATRYTIEAIRGLHRFYTGIYHEMFSLVMAVVSLHAFFLLLGSIFHKHPLVLSLVIFMLVNFLFLILGGLALKGIVMLQEHGYVITLYDTWCDVALSLVGIAFSVFCYWFAYRKYARLQVINNKWRNK